ncbi:MAG: lysylphosphatidylglycerol synthase transmembrane domain-containing protein [Planctomycetota bacterium]
MSRKQLVAVLKLVLAAGLVLFVLSRVNLVDKYRILNEDGKPVREQSGRILGDWRDIPRRFAPADDPETVLLIPSGSPAKDHRQEVQPGLPTYVRQMKLWLFLVGAIFYFLVASFSALRWWWLLRFNQLNVTLFQAFKLTWIGVFFNNVVPGLTGGDLVKAIYVVRLTGQKTRPIVSVFVDRVVGLMALALLAAIVVLFDFEQFAAIAYGIYGGLLLLFLGSVAFLSRRVRRTLRLDALLKRLPLSGLLQQVDQAIYFYRGHLKGMIVMVLLSVVNHLLGVIGVILIGNALSVGMPPLSYLILIPIINIASAVPVAPAGWGVGETLFQFLLVKFRPLAIAAQAMATRAVALSVVYRIHLMLWSLLGAMFLAFERTKPSEEEMSRLMDELEDEAGAGARAGA